MTSENAGDSGSGSDSRPVVYDLAPDCTVADVEVGDTYHAVVNGVVNYGVFVDVSDSVSGLVHESNLDNDYAVGDKLIVELEEVREDGDLAFVEAAPEDYRTEAVDHTPDLTSVQSLRTGDTVTVEGSVSQIKQTGGPTIFHVSDETGIVAAASFAEAGVRA
ncbi:S1 RNA-binding domain-containing protein, partial [Halobium palmae]